MMREKQTEGQPMRSSQDWIRQQMQQARLRIRPDQVVLPVYWTPEEGMLNPFEGTEYHAGVPVLVGYNIVEEIKLTEWYPKLGDDYGF